MKPKLKPSTFINHLINFRITAKCTCTCQDRKALTERKNYPLLKWDNDPSGRFTIINDKGIKKEYDGICFSLNKAEPQKFIRPWTE